MLKTTGRVSDMKSVTKKFSSLAARRAGLVGGVGLACLAALAVFAKDAPKLSVSDRPVDRSARGASYAAVIKRVQPSVVTIYSTRTTARMRQWHPFMDDPAFRQYFEQGDDSGSRRSRRQREESLGSGVVVSEDGYILTNNHVVEGADANGVKVAFADGKTKLDAKIIGKDPRTDLAVLKVEGMKFTAITLADSDKIEVGDVVLAVGNPFGVGQSVSLGIISAMGRGELPFGHMAEYEDFIQTDAAINPGNSGGALVDAEGRLIGINQSIVSGSGANAGVGFAIPANLARSVLEKLSADGKIARGFLGVELQPEITPELAKEFLLPPDAGGALVTEVFPDTPAARAGVQRDDVIVEFNGKKVADRRHLRLTVSQTAPDTKATVKVLRDGKEKILTVIVGAQPQEMAANTSEQPVTPPAEPPSVLDGVEVADLGRGARGRYGIPQRITGVLVTRVDADSKAAEAELRAGDVIVEINRTAVRSADEAQKLVGAAKGERITLRVFTPSAGSSRYLTVETGKK